MPSLTEEAQDDDERFADALHARLLQRASPELERRLVSPHTMLRADDGYTGSRPGSDVMVVTSPIIMPPRSPVRRLGSGGEGWGGGHGGWGGDGAAGSQGGGRSGSGSRSLPVTPVAPRRDAEMWGAGRDAENLIAAADGGAELLGVHRRQSGEHWVA